MDDRLTTSLTLTSCGDSVLLLCYALQVGSGATLTEVEVDAELTGRRQQQQGFVECSFPTIAGANGNGAIIHYRADKATCK